MVIANPLQYHLSPHHNGCHKRTESKIRSGPPSPEVVIPVKWPTVSGITPTIHHHKLFFL